MRLPVLGLQVTLSVMSVCVTSLSLTSLVSDLLPRQDMVSTGIRLYH